MPLPAARSRYFDLIRNSPVNSEAGLFVVRLMLVYLVWKIFFYIVHRHDWPFYLPWQKLVADIGSIYAHAVGSFMSTFEQRVSVNGIKLILYDKWSVRVEEHCIALPAMFVFASSILLFRGVWWRKLLFIATGWLGIIMINLVRVFFSAEAFLRLSKYYFELNHSFIYVLITYGFILLMINWWMKHQLPAKAAIG